MPSLARHLIVAVALFAASRAAATSPNVIFIMLDTTRADRLSALGNPRPTTPTLDALARDGVLFRRHFANSHATRPSFPQFMTGRYYHQNILRDFVPDAHPREFTFSEPDPTAVLLPHVLRQHGYQTLGASAHLWASADSPLGRDFDRLDVLPSAPRQGHADADHVVDRGITFWRERDTARPLFLYLHFMDMHLPRFPPDGGFAYRVDGYDWERRFRPNGEPLFGRERRRWDDADARDFTDLDRQHFTAVYDSKLVRTDAALARLMDVVRHDDPALTRTLIVVVADHGEELAEDGRTHHSDALADGVQHVPWIMSGAGLAPNQSCNAMTEHVDVLPTLMSVLGIALPAGVATDGSSRIEHDGRLTGPCGGDAAYFAWEDYRAVRTHSYLLEQRPPGSPRGRCQAAERLYHVDGDHRRILSGPAVARRLERLRKLLRRRLDEREAAFLARRYGAPHTSFLVRTDFWDLGQHAAVRCVPLDSATSSSDLRVPGWIWTGRGFTVLDDDRAQPLPVSVRAPSSAYLVEVAALPVPDPPWLFGFSRWLRKSFVPDTPSRFLPLGTFTASDGRLLLELPANVARGHHVIGVRLTPPGASPSSRPIDDDERERLRALGYVQ